VSFNLHRHAGVHRLLSIVLFSSGALVVGIQSARGQSPPYSGWINVKAHGAQGDGVTDDTAAILTSIAAAELLPQPAAVYFPTGTYNYSKPIQANGIAIYGAGAAQTILQATNVNYTSWTLTGSSPSICDITLRSASMPTVRNSAGDAVGILVYESNGFSIQRVVVGPVAGAGILIEGSSGTPAKYALISNSVVSHTLADGINVSSQSHYIDICGNNVSDTGDDLIAVVSYIASGLCSYIQVYDNIVGQQTNGRGISVVGGSNVSIEGNQITESMDAGVYLASEATYETFAATNIIVLDNTLTNVASSSAGQGAIHVIGRFDATTDTTYTTGSVTIQDNSINGAGRSGILIGTYTNNVIITGNRISNVNAHGIAIGPGTSNVTVAADANGSVTNIIESTGQYGVQVDPTSCSGTLSITGTLFESINVSGQTYIDVINIGHGGEFSSITVSGNHLEEPSNLHVERFINSELSVIGSALNTANIIVPNYIGN
jgi:parallel beta-helix repeat protein